MSNSIPNKAKVCIYCDKEINAEGTVPKTYHGKKDGVALLYWCDDCHRGLK